MGGNPWKLEFPVIFGGNPWKFEFLNKQGSLDGDTSRKASTVGDSKDIGGSRVNVDSTESSIDD